MANPLLVGLLSQRPPAGNTGARYIATDGGTFTEYFDNGTAWVSAAPGGPAFATIATSETTGSTSYTDLTTVGPSVTVNVGASGKLMVEFGAYPTTQSNGWYGAIAPQLSGANTLAAADVNWALLGSNSTAMYARTQRKIILSGLNVGSTTVTLKYKSGQSGFSWAFQDRDLIVTPL